MNTFKVGNVVVLKSGGPSMTIESIDGEVVDCVWFSNKELKRATFMSHSLMNEPPSYV
ncbi:MAG: DUF2158 domain-containing protein [Brumimicrobium sp.]|nr:DUF2158 domain-containing protein [Brumimicrobium sp.]